MDVSFFADRICIQVIYKRIHTYIDTIRKKNKNLAEKYYITEEKCISLIGKTACKKKKCFSVRLYVYMQ